MSNIFRHLLLSSSVFCLSATLAACDGATTTGTTTPTASGALDITNAVFTNTSADCADYAGSYVSSIRDTSSGRSYSGTLNITPSGSSCTFTSNSIPNHNVNGRAFAANMRTVTETFRVVRSPSRAAAPTALSLQYDNAIMLNGVKLDLLAAACYGVGNEPLGRERIGCFQANTPWRYDPMHPGNGFGTDGHNAHTQPDGAYHYHGDPEAMYANGVASPVIGFAADGFPIYGPFINDGGRVRRVESGYQLRSGARQRQAGEGAFPGGSYDGTYVDDWVYTGSGDLDECNGMVYQGSYAYFVTNSYPWVIGCFRGTPDSSFRKGR